MRRIVSTWQERLSATFRTGTKLALAATTGSFFFRPIHAIAPSTNASPGLNSNPGSTCGVIVCPPTRIDFGGLMVSPSSKISMHVHLHAHPFGGQCDFHQGSDFVNCTPSHAACSILTRSSPTVTYL